jgi:KilA-N domain
MLPDVILHTVNGVAIGQRADNGYINVTALSQAGGKRWPNFTRLQECQDFIASLSRSTQIRADLLLETVTTGPNERRGAWVHP